MLYVIKSQLKTGRISNMKYNDGKKAARYFKNHADCTMIIAVINDNKELISCYQYSNDDISNAPMSFKRELRALKLYEVDKTELIETTYNNFIAVINNDLTLTVEYTKSRAIKRKLYKAAYKKGLVTINHNSKKDVEYEEALNSKYFSELVEMEARAAGMPKYKIRYLARLALESTVIRGDDKNIIEVYFFNKKYDSDYRKFIVRQLCAEVFGTPYGYDSSLIGARVYVAALGYRGEHITKCATNNIYAAFKYMCDCCSYDNGCYFMAFDLTNSIDVGNYVAIPDKTIANISNGNLYLYYPFRFLYLMEIANKYKNLNKKYGYYVQD